MRVCLSWSAVWFLSRRHPGTVWQALVEGSSACNAGIQPGDCLMEVNGKSVYCKGIEAATKAILGKEGTVVTLKFMRVNDKGKRIPVSASIVREMRATANPEFKIKNQSSFSAGISTTQLYLECLQQERPHESLDSVAAGHAHTLRQSHARMIEPLSAASSAGVHEEQADEEEDLGAGVFGGSTAFNTDRSFHEADGNRWVGMQMGDGVSPEPRGMKERSVMYKGKWYTESEIEALEAKARQVKEDVEKVESAVRSPRGHRPLATDDDDVCSPAKTKKEAKDSRLVMGPSLVDLGKGPKPLSYREESLNSDPEALKAAILVVEGLKVEKVSHRKFVGRTQKSVHLKMSTGGVLSWGKGKSGHVMWVKAQKEQYDPSMSKDKFLSINCTFYVMLEGEQVMAHSSEGGTIRAQEAAEPMEFIAASPEDRDIWVTGIKMVLSMAKKEALERETKKRLQEVHVASPSLPSVFITNGAAPQHARPAVSNHSTATPRMSEGSVDEVEGRGAESSQIDTFGSDVERNSVRRAQDRGRRGWGGKIGMPGAASVDADRREGSRSPPSRCSADDNSPPLSTLSSTSTLDSVPAQACCGPKLAQGAATVSGKVPELSDSSLLATHGPTGPTLDGRAETLTTDLQLSHRSQRQPQQSENGDTSSDQPCQEVESGDAQELRKQPLTGDSDASARSLLLSQLTTAEDSTPRNPVVLSGSSDSPVESVPGSGCEEQIESHSAEARGSSELNAEGSKARLPRFAAVAASSAHVTTQADDRNGKHLEDAEVHQLPDSRSAHSRSPRTAPSVAMASSPGAGAQPQQADNAMHGLPKLKTVPAVNKADAVTALPAPPSSAGLKTKTDSQKKEQKVVVEEPIWPEFLNEVDKRMEGGVVTHKPLVERKLPTAEGKPLKPGPKATQPGKKLDFAELMAARQKKQKEAEEAEEGLYFD